MNKYALIFITVVFAKGMFAQTPIDVLEKTFKIGFSTREEFFLGFSEGDQLILNFEELNGKELKEFEIIEWPTSSRFMEYKVKRIENKIITINQTAIFKFLFTNTALSGRVCRIKIQRIPSSDATKNFNTTVYKKTVIDTTFSFEEEKYLIKSDTVISNIVDQLAKVHSGGNLNGNKTTFNFSLPENTIAWSYYIGVDQQGQEAYKEAVKTLVNKYSGPLANLVGFGPLASLAMMGISYIPQLQRGEDIDYYIVEGANADFFMRGLPFNSIKRAKVINDNSRMTKPLNGQYHFCLYNDNAITGVEVTLKVTAIVLNQQWGTRPIRKFKTTSREVMYLYRKYGVTRKADEE